MATREELLQAIKDHVESEKTLKSHCNMECSKCCIQKECWGALKGYPCEWDTSKVSGEIAKKLKTNIVSILHQSKRTKHAHSHSKTMYREYDVYPIEKAVCGKSIRCGRVTVGNMSDVTCPKCLEILKVGESHD